jgi:PAS domain S-box-containing protein
MQVENQPLAILPDAAHNNPQPKPMQEGLRTSEIRYRRLFEAARDGILILNADTLKITDVNPFMTELLGYSRDEFLGRELWEIGLFSDKEASQTAFRELQETGYLRYEDLPLQTIEGKLREVEFVSNVYEEGDHQVIQCNIRNITDRKRAEAERGLLLESEQAAHAEADVANGIKDEFLATLSHELRNPLTSILGWSQLLTDGKLDAEASKRALEIIVRNARAQNQLIDDLLDISRIITGKLRLDVRPVELAAIIETVVDGVRPATEARSIQLRISDCGLRIEEGADSSSSLRPADQIKCSGESAIRNPKSAIQVLGDPDRLQQIIWNLLTNAIKFTPEGGRVRVRLERIASHVEMTISDTGQGIAPEFLPHIFERFRQSDSSSTRRHGGLGLGLAIVRQLVEMHGGMVTAESPGEGAGTTFKVILPLLSVHQELSAGAMTRPLIGSNPLTAWQPSLNDLRVLVVDDEPDARELIAVVLTGRGADVVAVGSAGEALAEMERGRFDVLVSDIGMPLMDGYTLIEKVRQLPKERGGRIPAAALTAYAGVEDRMRALSAGYQMHIPKPVEPAELTTIVANLAERYAMPVAI